jgi:hypothetical protein
LNSVYAPALSDTPYEAGAAPSATTSAPPGASATTVPVIVTPPRCDGGSAISPTSVPGFSITHTSSTSSRTASAAEIGSATRMPDGNG